MIIYQGPSILDGSPIVVIATFSTTNDKTGDMVQIWILPDNGIAPHHNVKTGGDTAVCGNCPHKRGRSGQCYVIPFQAPLAVWTAFMAGQYPDFDQEAFTGLQVRFGAYGDPAAVPFESWLPILEVCDIDGSTGYSHQAWHTNWDPRIALFCQISVDTPSQAIKAQSLGYKTFRIAGDIEKRLPNEIVCLNTSKGITCAECALCDGQSINIVIAAHGALSNSVKQHDVITRG